MLVAGIVLGVVAVLMAVIYALAATIITDTGQGARSLLAATTTALVVLSGTTLICGWAVRTTDQATTALADRVNALCTAMAERREALEEVPQEMARLVAQVRVVAAEVPELAEAVRELTVRVEATEATVAAASTAQAIISRAGGTVVPMRPGGHNGDR